MLLEEALKQRKDIQDLVEETGLDQKEICRQLFMLRMAERINIKILPFRLGQGHGSSRLGYRMNVQRERL